MKKTAIGVLVVLAMAAGWIAPAVAVDAPYSPWGWIYLSTDTKSYVCSGTYAGNSTLSIYIVVEAPNWGVADAYLGLEAGVDYPAGLFNTRIGSDDVPTAAFFGAYCDAGHCSFSMGTGTAVHDNPWTAVTLDFVGFSNLDNLTFSLSPRDNYSPRTLGGPGWLYYDNLDPPVVPVEKGDGTSAHPGWQQGFVVLNYTQATAADTPFPATVFRDDGSGAPWPLLSDGDPCLRNKLVPAQQKSWGSLKAAY